MNRDEKKTEVSRLAEKLGKAQAVILAEYRGLKVSEVTAIRREIKKNSGDFRVVKNRLVKRAVASSAWAALENYLKGPLALATTDRDPAVLSKILNRHAENFAALKIKVGYLDGRIFETKEIEALARLPSKEELYACLLGTLLGPANGLVRVLQGVPQKLAVAVKGIAEKKQ